MVCIYDTHVSFCIISLTHISLESFLWDIGKQCKPDQTPQIAASDLDLHCLLTESLIKLWKNTTNNPKIGNGLVGQYEISLA